MGSLPRRRLGPFGLCLALLVAMGCSTYRDDLVRATGHYNDNQYEAALALFQVLEPDTDSLELKERADYFYYRGMTHYRLGQRLDARHWLGLAAATEKAQAGSVGSDEMKRLTETLDELNRERYGLAEASTGQGSKGAEAAGPKCKEHADCSADELCEQGYCKTRKKSSPAPTAEPAAAPEPAPEPVATAAPAVKPPDGI